MTARWRVCAYAMLAFAAGVFVRAGDEFLLVVLVAAVGVAAGLGFAVRHVEAVEVDRARTAQRAIERQNREAAASLPAGFRYGGIVGDRHPTLHTRGDIETPGDGVWQPRYPRR